MTGRTGVVTEVSLENAQMVVLVRSTGTAAFQPRYPFEGGQLMTTAEPQHDGPIGGTDKPRRCFVISPIGQEGSQVRFHADDVLKYIIMPALRRHNVVAERSDQIAKCGTITDQMFSKIVDADVCVVVATGFNPNVFYEMAVAQAAARPVIILLERGLTLPFDVKDLRCIEYEMSPISRLVDGVYARRVAEMLKQIENEHWKAPNLFEHYSVKRALDDELQVRSLLKLTRPAILPFGEDKRYPLPYDADREICLLTGDLAEIQSHYEAFRVDVVVSPENTDLQLGRYYDADSVSGILRYLDAERSGYRHRVTQDCLDQALRRSIKELGVVLPAMPGQIVATPTTQLKKYGIKYVFHVAALQGALGEGYRMMDEMLDDCVSNVFERFAEMATKAELSSLLFPMLGAATTEMEPVDVARKLLTPNVHRMKAITTCRKSVILARLESHRQAIHQAADELGLKALS